MRRCLAVLLLFAISVSPVYGQTPPAVVEQSTIAGTGTAKLKPGEQGAVSVTEFGTSPDGNYVQFIIYNGTDKTVSDLQAKVEIRDGAGTLLAADATDDIRPRTLAPGEFAIGHDYVSGTFTAGFQATVKVIDFEEGEFPYQGNISFGEVNMQGDLVAGEFINESDPEMEAVIMVGICYDVSGQLIAGNTEYIDEPMPIGEPVTFDLDMYNWGDAPCDTFIVSG